MRVGPEVAAWSNCDGLILTYLGFGLEWLQWNLVEMGIHSTNLCAQSNTRAKGFIQNELRKEFGIFHFGKCISEHNHF